MKPQWQVVEVLVSGHPRWVVIDRATGTNWFPDLRSFRHACEALEAALRSDGLWA